MSTPLLHGLAPLLSARTRVLVLGSFPGEASLAAQQYYAHPRNAFWPIVGMLLRQDLVGLAYAERARRVEASALGVWDVYASCRRSGSLDSAITDAQLNDFAALRTRCPRLMAVAHNGAESARHRRHFELLGLAVLRLPSTSPAHARLSVEQKAAVWRDALSPYLQSLAR